MEPEMKYPSPAPELHSKTYKRMKIDFEEEDYDSKAFSATKHDDPQWKRQNATSKVTNVLDPFSNPKLLQGLDTSKFGSVAKEIEALIARKSRLLNLDIGKNPTLPDMSKKNVVDLEDDRLSNDVTAVAPAVVILSSDDEDSGDGRHSRIYQKVVLREPVDRVLIKDSMDCLKSKATKENIGSVVGKIDFEEEDDVMVEEGSHQEFQKKESNYEADTEDDGLKDILSKTPSKDVINVADKMDIRIDKGEYVGTEDDKVEEGSNQEFQKKESNYEMETKDDGMADTLRKTPSKCVVVEEGSQQEFQKKESNYEADTEDDGLKDILSKTPSKDVINVAGKMDIRIDKGEHVGTEDDKVEEGSHQEFQKKESNYEMETKDDGMADTLRKTPSICVVVEEGSHQEFQKKESNYGADSEDDGLTDILSKTPSKDVINVAGKMGIRTDKGEYVGIEDDMVIEEENHQIYQKEEHNLLIGTEDDDLANIWKEMTFALECSKDIDADPSTDEHTREGGEECDHSFVLKDDLGYVCRICGVVDRGIESIFEFLYSKGKRTTRTYMRESQNTTNIRSTETLPVGIQSSGDDLMETEIFAHPRHRRQMKPHQVEGFNFLCSNLVTDNPGGCILAHAPGSGKTFMIISFMQSFLARYPMARPLVILPKGILATWKKEFLTWQVEDVPLLDLYSKAENRSQQLDVLRQWVDQKSILFLGYQQFTTIVCDNGTSKVAAECQEILLKVPSILILDEGHTARNEDTDMLQSIAKIQTPLKVVLSGTLYQNHVKEVFNILNLVRPKFMRLQTSQDVVKRIMCRVQISGVRKQLKTGTDLPFFDLVENTLKQKDDDFKRKAAVIQDLREMTSKVLHYYKGDFLDELPGLIDFTVMLNLSARQKMEVEKLSKLDKFKRNSVGSLVYMHPQLKYYSEKYPTTGDRSNVDDEKMDEMLEKLNVREGVKVKFFLNLLSLCESTGEKLLVFSQYILPLKLLERLCVKVKGWSPEKEIFTITGDSTSERREWAMECFNTSTDAKVFFGSIKACGEGISLVGASRILILDVHLNPSVSRQAIGRAFRPGQQRKVYTYRLVAGDSPEEEDHHVCFRKELISKMWFEWNENCGNGDFEMKTVDVNDCGDPFLESLSLQEDIKLLSKR